MMKTGFITAVAMTLLATPMLAQDVASGEKEFNKCKACHMIQAPDGTDIIKGGRTGPNLYGIVGQGFAAVEGFKYGDGILELKAAFPDAVWDVHSLKAYVTDPTAYLDEYSGNPKARSKMTFKLNRNQDDLVAYLLSVSPDAPAQPEAGDGAPQPAP